MIEFVSVVSAFVTVIGAFDLLAGSGAKGKVSDFISARSGTTFSEFEQNTIGALMSPFVWPELGDSELNFSNIFRYYTGPLSLVLLSVLLVVAAPGIDWDAVSFERVLLGLAFFFVIWCWCSLTSYPTDLFSLFITKRIFLDRDRPVYALPFLIVLDLSLSLIPAAVIFLLLLPMLSSLNSMVDLVIWIVFCGVSFSLLTSVMITTVQTITLLIGVVLRCVTIVARSAGLIWQQGDVRKYPFTTIGLLAGTIAATTRYIPAFL